MINQIGSWNALLALRHSVRIFVPLFYINIVMEAADHHLLQQLEDLSVGKTKEKAIEIILEGLYKNKGRSVLVQSVFAA